MPHAHNMTMQKNKSQSLINIIYAIKYVFVLWIFTFTTAICFASWPEKAKFKRDFADMVTEQYDYCDFIKKNMTYPFTTLVKVPLDYQKPQLGNFELSVYSNRPLSNKMPSAIMIDGGPGGTGRNYPLFNDNFNIIQFDQRGTGCSLPKNRDQLFELSFFSSINTARDIEAIRKALQLEQITVWGTSYGTVSATIYSSLFPNSTRSTILEGTVYELKNMTQNSHVKSLLAKSIDSLYRDTKDVLKQIEKYVANYTLPNLFLHEMYNDYGIDWAKSKLSQFANSLHYVALTDEQKGVLFRKLFSADSADPNQLQSETVDFSKNYLSSITYNLVACQEMPQFVRGQLTPITYENGTLSNSPLNNAQDVCEKYKIPHNNIHVPERYSLVKPVYYFQGEDDPATPITEALAHFRSLPKGPAQFMLATQGGGHTPFITHLRLQFVIFHTLSLALNKAITGEEITSDDIVDLNKHVQRPYYSARKIEWKLLEK